MQFDVRIRHRLTVPQLKQQQRFWQFIARRGVNLQAVMLAEANARILDSWITYRTLQAENKIIFNTQPVKRRQAA
jgi:hypothetical protein